MAVTRRHFRLRDALDELFVFSAVDDKILNISDFHSFFAGQSKKLGFPCHRAVGIHDFAAKAGRHKTRHTTKIDCRLRMPRALQYAPFPRAKREKMTGPSKIFGLGTRLHRFSTCERTLCRRDTRPRFHMINGFQKRRLMIIRISSNHRSQK